MGNKEENIIGENVTGENVTEENMSIEENFTKIEEILAEMQKEDATLERSFQLYNDGLKLIEKCNAQVDGVEKQIKILEQENNADE